LPREIPNVTPDEAVANRAAFVDFCRLKLDVRGPDVHMKTAGEGLKLPEGSLDQLWWFGVYTNFCSTPPAGAVFAHWPLDRVLVEGEVALAEWISENWKGLPVRKNRRPVRAPYKLARGLYSYATWVDRAHDELPSMSYAEAWDSVDKGVTYFGRYAIIKLLEVFRLHAGLEQLVSVDIHADSGWSPRKALALMYPEYGRVLVQGGNTKAALAEVNAVADKALDLASDTLNYDMSYYELEALLCNYRQGLSGTMYVGRTIDSELEYHVKVENHFGADPYRGGFDFFGSRAAVFPHECLGELNGWAGPREQVFDTFTRYGYWWSDRLYDYNATEDFANPVRRTS